MVSVRGLMVFVFLLLLIGGVFGEEVVIGDDAEAFGEKIIGLDDARLKAQYWSALSVQGKGEEFQKKVFDKLEYPDTYNIYLLLTNDEERNTFLEFAHNELREVIIWGEIQRNSNAPIILISLENEDYRSLKINDGRIIITDDDNIEHFIPTKDITGFKKISFSKIEKGGKGYAVHYLAGDEKSGAILSSGFLKNAGDGKWDVVEEGKRVGALSFGNEPKNAIYFRGVPNNKDGVSFSKGDYVWREKGRGSDVSFVYADGTTISADEGDITNEDGRYCGYVNEKGMRGASEIGGVKVRSIHKNNVGFKFGDKVIGSGSDSVVEIKKKSGGDIEVSFPSNVRNVEVVNPDGNVFVGKLQVDADKPLKIVNGKVQGLQVDRNGGGASGGRVKSLRGNVGNGRGIQGLDVSYRSSKVISDPMSAAVHDYINSYRGNRRVNGLQWDERIAEQSRQHSQTMARKGWINGWGDNNHYGFQQRLRNLGGGGGSENVAMFSSSKLLTPQEIGVHLAKQWINSRGHLNNLISSRRTRTGVGISMTRTRSGGYAYYGTQMFQLFRVMC